MKISFIIPAYNEANNLVPTIKEIEDQLSNLACSNLSYEILVIDDASTDQTFLKLSKSPFEHLSVLRLSRRSGSHTAIRAGLRVATGDAALCLAADGQDDPAVLAKMLSLWKSGADTIWALRTTRDDEPFMNQFLAKLFYKILASFNETKVSIDLSRADFYFLDRKVINAINACEEKNTSLFGLIVWLGFNQDFIEYTRPPRRHGQSKWNMQSKFNLAKDWIIAFSGLPLKIMTLFGFIISGMGFIYALFIISHSVLRGSPVQGWSSVITVALILGGAQIMMLGIIGEYLWRALSESKNRPVFFIEKQFTSEKIQTNERSQ